MARKKEPKEKGPPSIGNKKAYHLYAIEETIEAGIVLRGAEVKSLRAGKANLQDGYARIMKGELWLLGLYIQPYENQNTFYDIEPDRSRKLLLHKKQIDKLAVAVARKGYTLVPTKIYFTRGIVKVAHHHPGYRVGWGGQPRTSGRRFYRR